MSKNQKNLLGFLYNRGDVEKLANDPTFVDFSRAVLAAAGEQDVVLDSESIDEAGGKLKKTWRGMGNACQATVGYSGGAWRAQTLRSRHVSPKPFSRIKVVYPLFAAYGSGGGDQIFGSAGDTATGTAARQNLAFQAGLEYPYTAAVTGIAPRLPFTWDGQNYKQYTYATWDGVPYIVSDALDVGQTIPSWTPFGCFNTVESNSATAGLPLSCTGHNWYENRYEGYTQSGNSHIIGKGGASDVALTATSVTTFSTTGPSGYTDLGLLPAFFLVEVDEGVWEQTTVVYFTDSTGRNVGEGNLGPFRGDPRGSRWSNVGWLSRFIMEKLGYFYVGIALSGDGFKYVGLTKATAQYRLKLAAAANPTHGVTGYSINDNSVPGTVPNYANNTVYVAGVSIKSGGNGYLVVEGGTSAASGSPVSKNLSFKDGTATLRYIGPCALGEEHTRNFAASFRFWFKQLMPDVPLGQTTGYTRSTSSNFFVDAAGQTADSGWGDNTSTKGKQNLLIRSGNWPHDFFIETEKSGISNTFSLDNNVATEDSLAALPSSTAITFTGALVAATSGTLNAVWAGETNTSWTITFSDGTVKLVTLTNGSAAVSWTGAVTATASATVKQGYDQTQDGNHRNSNGYEIIARGIAGNPFVKARGV